MKRELILMYALSVHLGWFLSARIKKDDQENTRNASPVAHR